MKDEDNRELFFMYLAEWESIHTQFTADDRKAPEKHQQRTLNGGIKESDNQTFKPKEPAYGG